MLLEVETKVKVDNASILRNKIKKIAVHEKTQSRGDDYFALKISKYPKKAFRIRYDGEKFVVNFKRHLNDLYSDGIVVKEEYEFTLTDVPHLGNFIALLQDLGFKEWVKKRKHTESYLWKKDKRVVIEINHVEHVGTYMEIEFLAKRPEVPMAKKKILEVLKELEIKKSDIDNVGYTRRLYDKGIKDKKYFITRKFKKKSS
ncbi:MAG TPA: class IV adenylate cyclase [Candidatus Nanoarchaeia archaeon]|nr:class IV adenylate cyclase [Candidatus Nanoarchaeia archaeon]